MNNDYLNDYLYPDYLAHYGVKGMKWGVRRFQNKDGGLTGAGRRRYNTGKTMSPEEAAKKARRKAIAKKVAIGAGVAGAAALAAYGGKRIYDGKMPGDIQRMKYAAGRARSGARNAYNSARGNVASRAHMAKNSVQSRYASSRMGKQRMYNDLFNAQSKTSAMKEAARHNLNQHKYNKLFDDRSLGEKARSGLGAMGSSARRGISSARSGVANAGRNAGKRIAYGGKVAGYNMNAAKNNIQSRGVMARTAVKDRYASSRMGKQRMYNDLFNAQSKPDYWKESYRHRQQRNYNRKLVGLDDRSLGAKAKDGIRSLGSSARGGLSNARTGVGNAGKRIAYGGKVAGYNMNAAKNNIQSRGVMARTAVKDRYASSRLGQQRMYNKVFKDVPVVEGMKRRRRAR